MGIPMINDIVQQNDGKILIAGRFTSITDIPINCIARLNLDGSLDTSFNSGNSIEGQTSSIEKIILQQDGKILIIGFFGTIGGIDINGIARLNNDGSVDPSFIIGTGASPQLSIHSAALQSDGKIIVAGEFSSFNGINRNKMVRLNIDGSIDELFDSSNQLPPENYFIVTIYKQNNDKIFLSGCYSTDTGLNRINIAKLNNDGSFDSSFSSQALFSTGYYPNITSIQTQNDGKILIVGRFSTYNNISSIIRLNADGSIDSSFNPGLGATQAFNGPIISNALIQNTGKIIIVGGFASYYDDFGNANNVVRINTDGTLDTSFSCQGLGSFRFIQGAALQSDGKILLGGELALLKRFLSDENLNLTSNTKNNNLIFYPNPVEKVLTIKSIIKITEIRVYNNLGQQFILQKINNFEGHIDMEYLRKGIYFINIISNEQNEFIKIIKD